jgi:ubiquinone/menaquinone biosynthesis C-methylase UbiE
MSKDALPEQISSVIDPENAAEMARSLAMNDLLTKCQGGLFTPETDLSGIPRILDLGCGPGGWVHEVAFAHPEMLVEGIDNSQIVIKYAEAQARVQGLENTRFHLGNIASPLDFPDNMFDLVSSRRIDFFPTAALPQLMHEALRVTKPGGVICYTIWESPGTSTSAALEHLIELLGCALAKSDQNFAPRGHRFGTVAVLRRQLQDAGAINIKQTAHIIDYSADRTEYVEFLNIWRTAFKLMQPFLIKQEVATQRELDELYEQMLIEMLSDTFSAVMFLLTVTGRKPIMDSYNNTI